MLSRLRAHLPLWRRALRRRRRLLAALAVAALLAALLPTLLPPSTRGVDVVLADAPLAAGTVLTAEDLRTAQLAPELVPQGAPQQAEEVIGRTTRLALEPGTPLLPGVLEGPGLAAIPQGSALLAVPVPEAIAAHLRAGTEIALLSTDPASADGTAISAQVIEIIAPDGEQSALGGTAGSAEALVAVDRSRAGEVAHALGVGAIVVSVIG